MRRHKLKIIESPFDKSFNLAISGSKPASAKFLKKTKLISPIGVEHQVKASRSVAITAIMVVVIFLALGLLAFIRSEELGRNLTTLQQQNGKRGGKAEPVTSESVDTAFSQIVKLVTELPDKEFEPTAMTDAALGL